MKLDVSKSTPKGGYTESILAKLSPSSLALSPKMRWLIDSITGQDNGARGPRGEAPRKLAITSDGFVQSGNMFIGSADELRYNIDGILHTVKANENERRAFFNLYKLNVTDWR